MKNKFHTFCTALDLKRILANVADDCIVTARDRDCLNLDQMHCVNIPKPAEPVNGNIEFVASIAEVYGGDDLELANQSQQAIVFCDCD